MLGLPGGIYTMILQVSSTSHPCHLVPVKCRFLGPALLHPWGPETLHINCNTFPRCF